MNVILHGLPSRADFNGKDGCVTRDEAPVGRISVMVLADALKGAPPIAVLPKNLLLLSEERAVGRHSRQTTTWTGPAPYNARRRNERGDGPKQVLRKHDDLGHQGDGVCPLELALV